MGGTCPRRPMPLGRCLAETTALLTAGAECEPAEVFDHAGARHRRKALKSAGLSARHHGNPSVTAENLVAGETVNLTRREDEAFPPGLLAEGLGESFLKLLDAGGEAGRAFASSEQVCLQ